MFYILFKHVFLTMFLFLLTIFIRVFNIYLVCKKKIKISESLLGIFHIFAPHSSENAEPNSLT